MSLPIKRVVKVGGSLFEWPDFPARFWNWLHAQPPGKNYLVAGGGLLADAIRHYDPVLKLGEVTSHHLCLELLGTTAKLLTCIMQRAAEQNGPWPSATCVVDVREYVARSSIVLPECWDVTTDSLAALVARELHADELVLLKSASPAVPHTIAHAVQSGYVDAYFATAAAELSTIRAVNLRTNSSSSLLS